jgi:hypothetical protein
MTDPHLLEHSGKIIGNSGPLFTRAVSIWSVYADYGTQWQEVTIPSEHE